MLRKRQKPVNVALDEQALRDLGKLEAAWETSRSGVIRQLARAAVERLEGTRQAIEIQTPTRELRVTENEPEF